MKTTIQGWLREEKAEFADHKFGDLNFTAALAAAGNEMETNTAFRFHRCHIGLLTAAAIVFNRPVRFEHCVIESVNFHGAWFPAGFVMQNCKIRSQSTFDCGGHNRDPHCFTLIQNDFYGSVDFFDICFNGPVNISQNKFLAGTNLEEFLRFEAQKGISVNCRGNEITKNLNI